LPRIPLIWEAIVARVEPIGYPRLWIRMQIGRKL
jgi:hypothetical protein